MGVESFDDLCVDGEGAIIANQSGKDEPEPSRAYDIPLHGEILTMRKATILTTLGK